jgi:hypothetical protein
MKASFVTALICGLLFAATAAGAAERSCRAEIGSRAARALVRRCLAVSPATHPPCNALNPCALIRSEIVRSCAFIGPNRSPACRRSRGGHG